MRGIAVILVFISHIRIGDDYKELLFILGRIGVVLFLMMSGYLAYHSVQKKSRTQFAVNRFFRIYPMYWILLCLAFVINHSKWSLIDLLKNITLFQEYLGAKCILGASWMLSIMLVFFAIICLIKDKLIKCLPYVYLFLAIGAIGCSAVRHMKGIPVPTAFFLLQMIGFIGLIIRKENLGFSKSAFLYILIFEFILTIASILSYNNWLSYIIAYNLGIIVFYIFKNLNISVRSLSSFSNLGFTFFLGAGIPISFLRLVYPPVANIPVLISILLTFILTFGFSWIMTKYIEQPILQWGKQISGETSRVRKEAFAVYDNILDVKNN